MLTRISWDIVLVLLLKCSNLVEVAGRVNEIVVKVVGGPEVAHILALEHGHIFKGPLLGFDDTYIFVPLSDEAFTVHHKRDGTDKKELTKRLSDDNRVLWAEFQQEKSRMKRDFLEENLYSYLKNRRKGHRRPAANHVFNDELWTQEWYLQDTRSRSDLPKLDLNVLPVYKDGFTGRGVRISILDDGIEYTHDDLRSNYDPDISYDCNEDDYDPLPRYDPSRFNSHGTRCAGEIAMVANNGKCGVGIAFNARIGGVKMLDGIVTDRVEGTALSYARDLVDIYSASWGPNDDGKTVDGPGRLAKEALDSGIKTGRNGRGAIFVWASGNGGSKGDNCNCDGYLASPYTVSIGSASQKGEFPWYGEACASTLAVTYSSGAYKDQMIATTDLHNKCTVKHTGTSASAPLAAGIIALALEANPSLTWRDIQHLIVFTSEVAPVRDNEGWVQNAAGFFFNTRFGFGLMNAHGLVRAAVNWTSVPERRTCTVSPQLEPNKTVVYGKPTVINVATTGCSGTKDEVVFLEHVEVTTSVTYTVRGSLEIYLTSPSGSKVELLATRKLDKSKDGFDRWTFMSVMTWGEIAEGEWQFTVFDQTGPEGNVGFVEDVALVLHGTGEAPDYVKSGPRVYDDDYNRLGNNAGKRFEGLNVMTMRDNFLY